MGIIIRRYQDILPVVYVFRGQINFHIFNLQILDLISVDPTNTKEIFVKQDMFQPLLHYMERVQMVDARDYGSWFIDGKEQLKKYF